MVVLTTICNRLTDFSAEPKNTSCGLERYALAKAVEVPMAYIQKPGELAVFQEQKKSNPKGPDWTGTFCGLDGVNYRVALWEKGAQGTMLAGKIEPIERRGNGGHSPPRQSQTHRSENHQDQPFAAPFDDPIPF